MIQVDSSGRVRLIEGPVHHIRVHSVLRIIAGTKNSPERVALDPDGYCTYVLARSTTYNILHPRGNSSTWVMSDKRVTSIMVDREGRAWTGNPDNWKAVRTSDPTCWNRLLEEDDG